jgi:hypothetical protein
LAGREAATNAFLVSTPYVKNILSVMIGLNDFVAGNSVAVVESEWKSYMTAEKAAGWTTICITVLPTDPAQTGSGGTLINTLSAQFNSDMKGFPVGQYCDYISDFRADPVMGPNTAPNNSTLYFSDKQHPTTLGQQNLAAIYAATLNAIHP